MGALEFEPEFNDDDIRDGGYVIVATLLEIYNDRDAAVISPEDSLTMKVGISWDLCRRYAPEGSDRL